MLNEREQVDIYCSKSKLKASYVVSSDPEIGIIKACFVLHVQAFKVKENARNCDNWDGFSGCLDSQDHKSVKKIRLSTLNACGNASSF